MTEDFYDLLEVPPDATQQEITSAYREKVRDYHPDVNDDDRAQAQFTALTKANEILSDPVERQAYDRLGHETYVAKRTSGIPSPDVWATSDDPSTNRSDATGTAGGDPPDTERSATTTGGATTGTGTRATSSTSGSTHSTSTDRGSSGPSGSTSRSRTGSSTDRSTEAGTRSSTTTDDETTGTAGSSATGTAGSSTTGADSTTTRTDSTTGGTASTASAAGSTTARAGSTTARAGSTTAGTGSAAETAGTAATGETETNTGTRSDARHSSGGGSTATGGGIARWWRRRNVAMPLLWFSLLLYSAGIGQYALANESSVRTLWADLRRVGIAPAPLWETLSSSRFGLETSLAFVTTVEPVSPPLEPSQWYGLLAGIVGLAVVAVVLFRLRVRSQPWGPITMDETIVLALALGLSTGLYGGPLLAGAVLMPFLFGIVVHHTRRRPGWTPSYLYVVPVLGPAVGLAVVAAGFASLPVELLAVVVCPLVGGLWLPLRATIRKHLGR